MEINTERGKVLAIYSDIDELIDKDMNDITFMDSLVGKKKTEQTEILREVYKPAVSDVKLHKIDYSENIPVIPLFDTNELSNILLGNLHDGLNSLENLVLFVTKDVTKLNTSIVETLSNMSLSHGFNITYISKSDLKEIMTRFVAESPEDIVKLCANKFVISNMAVAAAKKAISVKKKDY